MSKFWDKDKMSAKIIVHKFETGVSFKSLQISIEEDESQKCGIKFGDWLDGKSFQNKKEVEKSSRLVVKIVSGEEVDNLDLDSCAKLISNLDISIQSPTSTQLVSKPLSGTYPPSVPNRNEYLDFRNHYKKAPCDLDHNIEMLKNECTIFNKHDQMCSVSPLEYSLEKVKENNARIMENIHMLNRTLNYTKKKEILDIVCPKSMRTFPCETCGKCFVYETGLKRHCITRHSIIELQPRWQVVWTCIECFQVWPQYELALKHSTQCCKSDSSDCVREIKTSSLLQCEFCEKVFTSIPRLLRHAKMHTTENNYECTTCQLSFISYKAAEEHWLICPWLKTYYGFSLPKLLLCNACDRKFRTYDQLYNHRYKTAHFIAKINSNTVGSFLYQCELCGNLFSLTTLLQMHKRQNHPYQDLCYNSVDQYDSSYMVSMENDEDTCNADNE